MLGAAIAKFAKFRISDCKFSEPDITAYMHQLARKKAKEEEVTHRQSVIVTARLWRVGDQMNLPSLEGSGRLLCMVSDTSMYSAYTHTGDGSLLRRAAATTPQCLPRVTDTIHAQPPAAHVCSSPESAMTAYDGCCSSALETGMQAVMHTKSRSITA